MMPPGGPMITLSIPRIEQEDLSIDMSPGDVLFVLGANGTGKSGLIQHLYQKHRDEAIRITAHRQTWMGSSRIEMSSSSKRRQEDRMRGDDANSNARWQDSHAGSRYQMSLFNLSQARNARNNAAIRAHREGEKEKFEEMSSEEGDPLSILNGMLLHSNMPITIDIQDDEEITAVKRNYSYGIAEMSDAERSILLLASDVLTCRKGAIVLIDEPERHMHRSISSSIIRELLSCRPDCFFIISTHELMLPVDIVSANILVLRDCLFQGKNIIGWDADVISSASEIDEVMKRDILGSRRTILFVEGENNSLDEALYSLLFPEVSVISKKGRWNVESSVKAIRGSQDFHWIHPYGIVDGDGYSEEKRMELRRQGIYPLEVHQVESIYYDQNIQSILFPEKEIEIQAARREALGIFSTKIDFLAGKLASRRRHEQIMSHISGPEDLHRTETIQIRNPDIMQEAENELRSMIEREDYDSILRKFSIKNTPALDRIADILGHANRDWYEREFRRLLPASRQALEYAKSLLGGLPERIAQDGVRMVSDQDE